jgi:hydroxymethylpyrimidine pyrophosphatase-like HAD family hydrolase
MSKIVIHLDLDNTVIYSKKHKQFDKGICIEKINDEEFGYMTEYSYKILKKLCSDENFEIVPVTTRNLRQYKRLELPKFKYALISNGSILLVDGDVNKNWYEESKLLADRSKKSLEVIRNFMESHLDDASDVRDVDDFFLYAKIENENEEFLNQIPKFDDIIYTKNITKYYFMPKSLSKLAAVKRFKQFLNRDITIAAGDNPNLDWCMEEEADIFIKPVEGKIYSDKIFKFLEENFLSNE